MCQMSNHVTVWGLRDTASAQGVWKALSRGYLVRNDVSNNLVEGSARTTPEGRSYKGTTERGHDAARKCYERQWYQQEYWVGNSRASGMHVARWQTTTSTETRKAKKRQAP